ncbi:MAG: scaffolding protein [Thermoguttaceae bacterium]|nr:scaffolding protein [Thermoguttaceae bacterium]
MTEKTKESWYDECIALKQEERLGEAIAELRKLIQAYPDFGLAHLALAVYLEKEGNADECLQEVTKACELETGNSFYFTALSSLAIKQGNRQAAEEALMKAQELRFAAILKEEQDEKDSQNK